MRYDTIEEFNVDSKAECDQLNLALETKTKYAAPPIFSKRKSCRNYANSASNSAKI